MIEQTGVAEARQAIANSEVVEETGLTYRSYSKKTNLRRQWSPHGENIFLKSYIFAPPLPFFK